MRIADMQTNDQRPKGINSIRPLKTNYSRMKLLFVILVLSITFFITDNTLSAQVNTLYFMENVPARNNLNPAFIPTQNFYIDLPVISGMSFMFGNNSFTLNDLLQPYNGKTITAFHPEANPNIFLNSLQSTTNMTSQNQINLFGFGLKIKQNYFTFGMSERTSSNLNIPKGLVSLILKGTPDTVNTNFFNLKTLGSDESAYLETAFGYARQVTDQFSIGMKMKLLFGQAHADASFSQFNLNINRQIAQMIGNGTAHITTPFDIPQNSDGTPDFANAKKKGWGKIVGFGMGFDLGMNYAVLDNFHISAAMTDLGFIHWYKSSWEAQMTNSASFSGMAVTLGGNNTSFAQQLGDSIKTAFTYQSNGNGYTTSLQGRVRLGADYSVWNDKMAFGMLWQNAFGGPFLYDELTLSANYRPTYWFNASLSYSVLNGSLGTIGLGLNAIAGPVNFFLISDYIPLYFTKDGYPYKSKYLNLQVGIALTFGHKKKIELERIRLMKQEEQDKQQKDEEPPMPEEQQILVQ
jgi:hypothetical protein